MRIHVGGRLETRIYTPVLVISACRCSLAMKWCCPWHGSAAAAGLVQADLGHAAAVKKCSPTEVIQNSLCESCGSELRLFRISDPAAVH